MFNKPDTRCTTTLLWCRNTHLTEGERNISAQVLGIFTREHSTVAAIHLLRNVLKVKWQHLEQGSSTFSSKAYIRFRNCKKLKNLYVPTWIRCNWEISKHNLNIVYSVIQVTCIWTSKGCNPMSSPIPYFNEANIEELKKDRKASHWAPDLEASRWTPLIQRPHVEHPRSRGLSLNLFKNFLHFQLTNDICCIGQLSVHAPWFFP